ncbi:ABC transporter permease subunit [Neptunomonas antarctica]|uniref:Thiamine transport system permease protein n=1 Tax=Neptunomonas antarctica TaxID=619304 RepID=A0A1N7P4M3_9GAMM|nr:ABC transporter permease subunit [Neptunomonas antarctica]SIT05531.1 thiamine transport system permease protein [Neptunomonas antarctica]
MRLHWLAYSFVLGLTVLSFYGLISFGNESLDTSLLQDSYFYSILGFTLKQALISAVLSVGLAIPIARALYFLPHLPYKKLFLAFCLLCFVTPTLIVITGLVALLGRSGFLTPWLNTLSDNHWNIYGMSGILIAHVFMNMPLAVRIIYLELQSIPETSWKLASQLKLNKADCFRIVEWPTLRNTSILLLCFIFVLCFNSFAVVLALGGGPQSTTLEVAIYQALKYDFNIPEALTLAWTQLIVAGGLYWLISRFGSLSWKNVDSSRNVWRPKKGTISIQASKVMYGLAWIILLLPFVSLIPGLLDSKLSRPDIQAISRAAAVSIGLAIIAATLAMSIAYALLHPIRQAAMGAKLKRLWLLESVATHTLISPAMVLSVGLYIFLLPRIDIEQWGIVFVILLNTALVIPFAVKKLKPRLLQFDQQYNRLARSLKLNRRTLWRIEWPFIKEIYLATFGLVLVLALGDVAIFSIFGTTEWTTLPWLIYGYASSYRIAEASAASFILLILCALFLFLLEKLVHKKLALRPLMNQKLTDEKQHKEGDTHA